MKLFRRRKKYALPLMVSLIITNILATSIALAESGRADYDLDDDGLIEINDVFDLNEIRYDKDGSTLYGSNEGCPSGNEGPNTGCVGYELTTDLNFDLDGSGAIEPWDGYWNSALGWDPIEEIKQTIIEGNGHTIYNLYINRHMKVMAGLFGTVYDSEIRNLHIRGNLTSVHGSRYSGGLIGYTRRSTIYNCSYEGPVMGLTEVGGLIGYAADTSVSKSYAKGYVSGRSQVGGLIGEALSDTRSFNIEASFANGIVTGKNYVGGLVGYANGVHSTAVFATGALAGTESIGGLYGASADGSINMSYAMNVVTSQRRADRLVAGGLVGNTNSTSVNDSYWAVDLSGQRHSADSSYFHPLGGAFLNELICPTGPNNNNCSAQMSIYKRWEYAVDSDGNPYWDYGTDEQAPGLIINGQVHRDSDGDGAFDEVDIHPLDTDNDLRANHIDPFPITLDPLYY